MSYRVENRFIGTLRHFNIKYLLINRHKGEPVTPKENEWSAVCSEVTRVLCGKLVIEFQHCFRKIVVALQHFSRKTFGCTSALFEENILLYFSTIFGK
jgi:hypothetical protein